MINGAVSQKRCVEKQLFLGLKEKYKQLKNKDFLTGSAPKKGNSTKNSEKRTCGKLAVSLKKKGGKYLAEFPVNFSIENFASACHRNEPLH